MASFHACGMAAVTVMKAVQPMSDDSRSRAPLPSPCINVCDMDAASGWCRGCLRTLDEISRWSSASDDDKRAIWIELEKRQQTLTKDKNL